MLKLGILGLQGRVGQAILKELSQHSSFILAKGLVRSVPSYRGGALATHQLTPHVEEVFDASDVIVDFTHADAVDAHLAAAVSSKKPFFLGTTGLTPAHNETLRQAAQHIPLLKTSNTSLGIAVLEKAIRHVASFLGPSYAINIREIHHGEKKDAPSGTALSLAKAMDEGQRLDFSVARGGDCVGEHEVLFMGPGEILRFSHQALNISLFAKGALQGAQWLVQQSPGLYKMADVLEVSSG